MRERGHGEESSETQIETEKMAGFSAFLFPFWVLCDISGSIIFASLRAEGGPDRGPPLDHRASAIHRGTPTLLENAIGAPPSNIAAIG